MEIEANHFAASILMPEALIRLRVSEIVDWIDTDQDFLAELSEQFEVSSVAMSIRLQNLGLIPSSS